MLADVVDGDDVGMVEGGGGARLLLETGLAIRIHHARRHHLDGDVAPKARIMRAVHFAHAARAKRRDDGVRAEAVPGGRDNGS